MTLKQNMQFGNNLSAYFRCNMATAVSAYQIAWCSMHISVCTISLSLPLLPASLKLYFQGLPFPQNHIPCPCKQWLMAPRLTPEKVSLARAWDTTRLHLSQWIYSFKTVLSSLTNGASTLCPLGLSILSHVRSVCYRIRHYVYRERRCSIRMGPFL